MCAETIPAEAIVCPYCDTRLISAPPPQTVSPVTPRAVPPAGKPKRTGLVIGLIVAGLAVLCILTGIVWVVSRGGIAGLLPSAATPTLTPTITPSPTPSPTATVTATPLPDWVTDFAQPILNAIASRAPNYQDDFTAGSGGWQGDESCGRRMEHLDGEILMTGCALRRPNIDYSDFVVEFDARLYPGVKSDSEWRFNFRDMGNANPNNSIQLTFSGDVFLHFYKDDITYDFPRAANPGNLSNHIMVIGKGSRIAIYLNNQPLFYYPNSIIRYGDFYFRGYSTLAVDNFRIWNIDDISIP
jgi:hypothetical protein